MSVESTPELEEEPEPTPLIRGELVEWQVRLPADLDIERDSFEQFFRNLAPCHEPVAFELLGTAGRVLAQFVAGDRDASIVRRQLQAHFPDTMFRQQEGTLEQAWNASQGDEAVAVEFGLESEFMLPLASGKLDPFVGIVGVLAELQPGELGVFQILWQPVSHPWAENITRSVTRNDGKPFFVNYPELTSAAEEKITRPLYAVVVRLLLRTATSSRWQEIARELAGSLRAFSNPQGNSLIPLHNEGYSLEDHIEDVLRRQSRRSGMVLNSDELIGFVHLPSGAVKSPALQRDSGKTKAAPAIVREAHGILLGDNEHGGETIPVYLSSSQRVRHTHIIGQSGTGKSTLLFNLIRQDINSGQGVAVLDPHGDLIDDISSVIPDNRIDDVVLVNPSDVDFPIGFNILQAHSEEEKNLLASDLVSVFRRLSTSWGDQMDTVLQNAILAFLESTRGGTLADLRRFLVEPSFRVDFLQSVKDPELIYYWQKVLRPDSGGKSIGPVLTRLQDFFSRKPLRNMVSQSENKLDFGHMMDNGKIFLAKLSEGLLGKENSYLLGTLLISKFQQLAMARQAQNIAVRRDFWIYIDEFYNFITPSMAEILQGARKYRIGLTLAHHNLKQLERQPEVASAVMTHPCIRIVFQVGDDDAKRLEQCFETFDAKSLKTLERFHAIARVERNDFDFNVSSREPAWPEKKEAESTKNKIIAASRSKYATARTIVEAALLANIRGANKEFVSPASELSPQKLKPTPPQPTDPELKPPEVAKPSEATQIDSGSRTTTPKNVGAADTADPTLAATIARDSTRRRGLGRGGPLHLAIQNQIKEAGESSGFIGNIEKSVLQNKGSIDVLLERNDGVTIACEIALTSTVDDEVKNILKCIQAGHQNVAIISTDQEHLGKIGAQVLQNLSTEACKNVRFFDPEAFLLYLKTLPPYVPPKGPKIWRGRRVTHSLSALTPEQQKRREAEAIRSIADAMQTRTRKKRSIQ